MAQGGGSPAGRRETVGAWWPVSAAWKRIVAAVGGGLQLLWRIRLGWLTGHALLVLTHVGRHTGKQYRTVLYVQRYDRRSRQATVISVWGDSAGRGRSPRGSCATCVVDCERWHSRHPAQRCIRARREMTMAFPECRIGAIRFGESTSRIFVGNQAGVQPGGLHARRRCATR